MMDSWTTLCHYSLSALLGQFLCGALSKLPQTVIITSSRTQFTKTLEKHIYEHRKIVRFALLTPKTESLVMSDTVSFSFNVCVLSHIKLELSPLFHFVSCAY